MRHTVSENESASFPKLVNRVHFLKSETKGMEQMCEIMDLDVSEYECALSGQMSAYSEDVRA